MVFGKIEKSKKVATLLVGSLVVSSTVPSFGNVVEVKANKEINLIKQDDVLRSMNYTTGGAVDIVKPEKDKTYTYDFKATAQEVIVPATYDKTNPIETLVSPDGLMTINGNGKMYNHNSAHGLVVYDGNSFEVKVAGNAIITFDLCSYSKDGTITGDVDAEDGMLSKAYINLKGEKDGEKVSFKYSGEATTLTFTINGNGYLHGLTVENTSETLDMVTWAQKDFKIGIGEAKLDVTGALTDADLAEVTAEDGDVYYALSEKAYVSVDLKDKALRPTSLTNYSPEVVESLAVDGNGDVVVTFKDQTTYPYTYTIKVQDKSKYKTPEAADTYTYAFTGSVIPSEFTSSHRIEKSYTVDDGIVTIGKGEGAKAPYWHGSGHGLALYGDNYIDVKVAGDAVISFARCQYSSPATLTVSNLAEGAEGTFDYNEMQGACNSTMTYTYTGEATTLRFTLEAKDTVYLHGMTVKNTGAVMDSEIVNPQLAMPYVKTDNLSVVARGHRLLFAHEEASATITSLNNVGYYLFEAYEGAATIEVDIKISSIGSSSSQGILVGMFEDAEEIISIATVGIRGGGKIRNIYNKQGTQLPAAGGLNVSYNKGDTIHIKVSKEEKGWYSEVTVPGLSSNGTIKYTNTALLDDSSTKVAFGLAFANASGTISNLTYKDAAGNVLYAQTDCYAAMGTAPTVECIEPPVISEDRTQITVKWEGDTCKEDAAYQVELSKDGGKTYTVLAKDVTSKSYTYEIDGNGEYVFRISGLCGLVTTAPMVSESVSVIAPLATPNLVVTGGDTCVNLSWDEIAEATTYEVYRKAVDESAYTLIQEVCATMYTDTAVENETPYYYYIVAKSVDNTSNPSMTILTVPTAGREGSYVYEEEAAKITMTQESNDTVYTDEAVLAGYIDREGQLELVVNDKVQETVSVAAKDAFAFTARLQEGRNAVELHFTDELGKVTRQAYNFVYLTQYDLVVDSSFESEEGEESTDFVGAKMYRTVQSAVNSVPSNNKEQIVILIKEGNYREHLVVTSPYITLIGEDREKVNINFYDAAEGPAGGDTSLRPSVYVKGSAKGFAAENLTFENTYDYLGDGSISNESADALRVDADQATFVNVKILGYQDTLQTNTNHQYFYKCYIGGNIDYIYGTGQTLFEDCDLVYRYSANKNAGYITAPKTDADDAYGYIFNNCRVLAESGCNRSKYLLARPWGPDGAATFINTYMGGIVNKTAPYADMSGNLYTAARFNEYYSYGAGFEINNNRLQISKTQAEKMLTPAFLGWDPYQIIDERNANYLATKNK